MNKIATKRQNAKVVGYVDLVTQLIQNLAVTAYMAYILYKPGQSDTNTSTTQIGTDNKTESWLSSLWTRVMVVSFCLAVVYLSVIYVQLIAIHLLIKSTEQTVIHRVAQTMATSYRNLQIVFFSLSISGLVALGYLLFFPVLQNVDPVLIFVIVGILLGNAIFKGAFIITVKGYISELGKCTSDAVA